MKTSVIVQNLKCGGCAKTITSKISELNNISNVIVNIETSSISFISKTIDEGLIVKQKLKELGYPSIDADNSILLKAKSFVSCVTGKISKD